MTSSSLLGIDSTRCRRYSQSSIFWHHSFLSAMGASEFFLAWSKILRRLLSGILSCALICFRGTEAFQSSTAALLTSLVGGIFKTGETRKIGLAYILRNGEFSCDRTVKFRPDLIRDHSSIPKKFGVPISKGLGAVHCQRPAKFFCADCIYHIINIASIVQRFINSTLGIRS